jgi:hypothetical protein
VKHHRIIALGTVLQVPSQIISKHEAVGDQFTIHGNAGPKSWSVH